MLARKILPTCAVIIVFATCASQLHAQTRQWSDRTGKFSVEAEFVQVKDDAVVLKKSNGGVISVSVAKLSSTDQAFLKGLRKPEAQANNRNGKGKYLTLPDAVTTPPSWHDANSPFDLAEFLKAPTPEGNAASLYLEVFCEFDEDALKALLPQLGVDDNNKKVVRLRELNEERQRLDDVWENDPSSVDVAAVDALLDNYKVGFQKLSVAQQRAKCVFQTGMSFHTLLPHCMAARRVARIYAWKSERELQQKNLEGPIKNVQELLRLSRDLRPRGSMVAQLVANGIDEFCSTRLIQRILSETAINQHQCDELIKLLTEHEAASPNGLLEGNRCEYIMVRQVLHDLQHRTGTFDPQFMKNELKMTGDVTSPMACFKHIIDQEAFLPKNAAKTIARLKYAFLPAAWRGGKMFSDADYQQEVAALNRYYKALLALSQSATHQIEQADVEDAEKALSDTIVVEAIVAPQNAALLGFRRSTARVRGIKCLIALRLWTLKGGDGPDNLEALAKAAGMSNVPIDPWSGQPLRMILINGKPVVYAIGPDKVDDQAQLEWDETAGKKGDFIFRLGTTSN